MNRRYLHRRRGIWHFRMPVPLQHHKQLQQKELTASLQTTQYAIARSKANFLEHLILTELLPMYEHSESIKVEKTIRKFMLNALKLYDTVTAHPDYTFSPATSLYNVRQLHNQLKSKDMKKIFSNVATMYGTWEPLESTISERNELLCRLEESKAKDKKELSISEYAALLSLQSIGGEIGDEPYRLIHMNEGDSFLFSTHTPDRMHIIPYCPASRTISCRREASSVLDCFGYRWLLRECPKTLHARRSDMP
jgi:hypothetical protein